MIGGKYTIRGGRRDGRLGAWQVLSDQDGQVHGGLSLNPTALDEAAAHRLSGVIRLSNNLPGVLKLIDQAAEGNLLWLISATPASPTIKQALGTGSPIPGAVSLQIAVDCGQTLTALHAAGTAHGDLSSDTVVLGATGAVTLAECGYAHALAGTTPGPGHDVNGWVAILRSLAAPRPNDTVKQLLESAAMQAEATGGAPGLATGLAVLTEGAAGIPGYADRGSLALVSATVSSAFAGAPASGLGTGAGSGGGPGRGTGPGSVGAGSGAGAGGWAGGAAAPHGGDDATMLLGPAVPDNHAVTLAPQELATRLGNLARENVDRATPRADGDGVIRFGRGVAAPPPAGQPLAPAGAPAWHTGTAPMPIARKRKRGFIAAAITFVLTVALFAAVGWALYERGRTPLAIVSATTAPSEPMGTKCNFKADVIGRVVTNGERGTIKYHWEKIEGTKVEVIGPFEQDVPKGTSTVDLHLIWEFGGKGTATVKAVLKVEAPQVTDAPADLTYNCK